jgi:hypothetical protein
MSSGVAVGVRVDTQETHYLHPESGLLLGLPNRRLFERLPYLHEAAR